MAKNRLVILAIAAVVLAAVISGTASAATFSGEEKSTFYGDDTAGWRSQIDDTQNVDYQDTMYFKNQWYNGHVGTSVPCRVVYGGGQSRVCTSGDSTVTENLGYLNYYPSSTSYTTKSSTVTTSYPGTYNLVVSHKYYHNDQWKSTDATWTIEFTV